MRIQNVALKIHFPVPKCLCKQSTKNVFNNLDDHEMMKRSVWFLKLEGFVFNFEVKKVIVKSSIFSRSSSYADINSSKAQSGDHIRVGDSGVNSHNS